jgi:predicted transcriptional regulator YheO
LSAPRTASHARDFSRRDYSKAFPRLGYLKQIRKPSTISGNLQTVVEIDLERVFEKSPFRRLPGLSSPHDGNPQVTNTAISEGESVPTRIPELRDSLKTLGSIVPLLAQAIGPQSEVILHDLTQLPNSIVAIGGNLTKRSIGGPINTFVLELIRQGTSEDFLNYMTHMPDGRTFRSSTIFIQDEYGKATACLCINVDVTDLLKLRDTLTVFTTPDAVDGRDQMELEPPSPEEAFASETFPITVDEVMVEAVRQAIGAIGVPADLMQKRHKLEVVRILEERGLFLIRDAVDFVASALGVTRYTIYNYLNELRPEEPVPGSTRRRVNSKSADSGT